MLMSMHIVTIICNNYLQQLSATITCNNYPQLLAATFAESIYFSKKHI